MLRPRTWDRKSQPPYPRPTPTPAWASPACQGCNRPSSSSSQSVFSSRGVSGGRVLGTRSAPGRALQVLPSPLPPTRMLGLPGKCPSLRAPPRPRRRDRPTDAEKKRERWTDEKKALTSKREGRGCMVNGCEPRLQPPLCFWPSCLRAGLWAGAHPGRGEGQGHGVGGSLGTHLAGHSGLLGRLGALAAVSSLH